MHDKPMTLDDLESHLDRYGADLDRWPAESASQAKRLIADSSGARSLLAEASALAALLDDALPAATLSTGAVRSRILATVTDETAKPRMFAWLTFGPRLLRPVAIAAAIIPLVLGYAIGIGYEPGGVNDDLVSDVSLLAFADYEAYSDAN
jgi:hypothetical protein